MSYMRLPVYIYSDGETFVIHNRNPKTLHPYEDHARRIELENKSRQSGSNR